MTQDDIPPIGPDPHSTHRGAGELNAHERRWITARVNRPGWNIFYGVALLAVTGLLTAGIIGAQSQPPVLVICLALLPALAGLWLGWHGLRRAVPLQRMRHARPPRSRLPVTDVDTGSIEDVRVQVADGRRFSLSGPVAQAAAGKSPPDRAAVAGSATLSLYGDPARSDGVPARLRFGDGTVSVGLASSA